MAETDIKHRGVHEESKHDLQGNKTLVISDPPDGKKRVLNIYYDPSLKKYVMTREE